MRRAVTLALVLSAAVFGVAAPIPKEDDAARIKRIYGNTSDPSGDAKFELNGDTLRIVVPERPQPPPWDIHAVRDPERAQAIIAARSANPGPWASASIWREIKGDFTATVRVSFPIRPKAISAHDKPSRSAGLVAWVDEGNHMGLSRVEEPSKPGMKEMYHLTFTHALGVRTSREMPEKPNDAGFVRLVRKGQTMTGAFCRDGKNWTELPTEEVEWKDTVKVGVYVKNFSDAKLEATFDEYTLSVPKQ